MLLADYNKGLIVTLHVLLVWCHVSWGNYLPRNNRRKFVRVDNEDRFRSPRIVILGKAYLTDFFMMMICFYFLNAFLYANGPRIMRFSGLGKIRTKWIFA